MVGGQETGNETYVKGLVEGLKTVADGLDVVVYHRGKPWTEPAPGVRFDRLMGASPYVRLGVELPLRSLAQRLDVLHMTYASPIWSAAPTVLTVHDICYATHPEWFSARDLRVLNANIPRSIRAAAHVITDSQSARGQIMERYNVPSPKITAIPIGAGAGATPISEAEASAELEALHLPTNRAYLLAVGNLQPRKNLVRLVQAFRRLVTDRHLDLDLVIVGPRHFRADEALDAARAVGDRVHFTGYVTDRQLAACYQCSAAFVFPSLYEGFGLPALEAMAHGVPCVCSSAGSLPEICGEAAVYFDPMSVEDMTTAIERVLADSGLREKLSLAGQDRARLFTWSETARLTIDIYRKAAA
jgi:glycosyltransferase involved in cell wall biosynthesis